MAKYTKEVIGLSQLDTAITLWNSNDYIAALTLGAVAEEIFKGYIDLKNMNSTGYTMNALELEAGMFDVFRDFLGINNYPSYFNRVRNELKHHGEDKNKEVVTGDFKQISMTHISHAIQNYFFWKGYKPKSKLVEDFCIKIGLTLG